MSNDGVQLGTYLNYGGNCAEAFRFYEEHLGGRITQMLTHENNPMPNHFPPEFKTKILHARITIGNNELMASDVPPDRFQPMRSVYLSLGLPSTEEAERVYGVLSEGGEVFMQMQETFFAHRFGMLRDRFGTSWMIAHNRSGSA